MALEYPGAVVPGYQAAFYGGGQRAEKRGNPASWVSMVFAILP